MKKNNKQRDWVEILPKLLTGIGALIAGVLLPYLFHVNSEKNRSNQLYADIVSKREVADSELRAKMFENLIKSFFGDNSKERSTDKEKINLLRLLAFNFHESFNLKPLFEALESELKDKDSRSRVRKIAKEIVGRQEAQLSQIVEGRVYKKRVMKGKEEGIMIPPSEDLAYKGHRLGIEVVEIGKDDDYVRLHVWDMPDKSGGHDIADIEFDLTYYDMPFVDNTKLFNATRFSITLNEILTNKNTGDKTVDIKVIFFPESYMSGRDRPYLDEMLEQLRKGKGEK
jgi:uncharacterized Rmd1/YagE family protein